jgi:hypothetical protein
VSRFGARARLGEYVKMSTANPTGWRPWNSRLSFYLENSYPLPTTGRGPFLLQPDRCGCAKPTVNGGMAGVGFPNYPGIGARGNWITHGGYPAPVYRPPSPVQLSGLGVVSTHTAARNWNWQPAAGPVISPSTPSGVAVAQSNGSTSTATGSAWQNRRSTTSRRSSGRNRWNQNQTSTPGTGGADTTPAAVITGYDADGNPIYAGTPAGQSIIGYDSAGNAVYSGSGTAATTAPATEASSAESWFSEDSLGLGLNNGIYAIGAVALILILRKK